MPVCFFLLQSALTSMRDTWPSDAVVFYLCFREIQDDEASSGMAAQQLGLEGELHFFSLSQHMCL